MRHYAGYHNVEKMGEPNDEADLLTSTPADPLRGSVVWMIEGRGNPRSYSVDCVFVADRIDESPRGGFEKRVSGRTSKMFRPRISLDDQEWLPEFLRQMANFSLGPREIKDERVVHELLRLAASHGFHLPEDG